MSPRATIKALLLGCTAFFAGCAGGLEVKGGAEVSGSGSKVDGDTSWSSSSGTPAPQAARPATSAPAPVTSEPAPTYAGTCTLSCFQPRLGPIQPDENASLTAALAGARAAVSQCGGGRAISAVYTLRFSTAGDLMDLGVEAPTVNEAACVDAVRSQTPTVSLTGRHTVRCVEKCPRGNARYRYGT